MGGWPVSAQGWRAGLLGPCAPLPSLSKTTRYSCNPRARPPLRAWLTSHPAPRNPSPRRFPRSQRPHTPPPCPAQLWPLIRAPVAPTLVSSPSPTLFSLLAGAHLPCASGEAPLYALSSLPLTGENSQGVSPPVSGPHPGRASFWSPETPAQPRPPTLPRGRREGVWLLHLPSLGPLLCPLLR